MGKVVSFTRLFAVFLKSMSGCVNTPYVTYRKLSDEDTDTRQTFFIFLLVLAYFSFAALLRVGIRNPFLLTAKFYVLMLAFAVGFFLSVLLLTLAGKILNKEFKITVLFTLWAYSLVPTIIWFFTTSVLYVVLPPPRTLSVWGKIYSVVYVSFSIGMLYWKSILYYLTLRFGLRLDLGKITAVSAVFIPSVLVYSFFTYRLGIFKIPFI